MEDIIFAILIMILTMLLVPFLVEGVAYIIKLFVA